jgi:hypothetical protein
VHHIQNMIRAAWKETGLFLCLGQFLTWCIVAGNSRPLPPSATPTHTLDGSDAHRCKIKVDKQRLVIPFPAPHKLPVLRSVQSSTDLSTLSPTFIVPKPDMDIIRAQARRSDRNLMKAGQVTLQELCDKYHRQRTRKPPGLPPGTGYQVKSGVVESSADPRSRMGLDSELQQDQMLLSDNAPQLFAFVGELHRKIPFYLGLGTVAEGGEEVDMQYLGFTAQGKGDPFSATYKLAWADPADQKTVYAKVKPSKNYPGIEPCVDTYSIQDDVLTQ